MNFDHHNGKSVTKIENAGSESKIIFEDGSVVTVSVDVPKEIVGEVLLLVEVDDEDTQTLVFGRTVKDGPAIREHVVDVPAEAPVEPSEGE